MELEKIVYIPMAKLKFEPGELDKFGNHLFNSELAKGAHTESYRNVMVLLHTLIHGNATEGGGHVVELSADDVKELFEAAEATNYSPLLPRLELANTALESEAKRLNTVDLHQG